MTNDDRMDDVFMVEEDFTDPTVNAEAPAAAVGDLTAPDPDKPVVVAGQSEVAEFMLQMNPGKFMFVPGIGFYVYDGRRWDQGNGEARALVAQAVVEAARAMIVVAADVRESRRRDELLRLGHRVLSSSTQVAGVVDFVELHPAVLVTADRLNADPFLLNVQNGTLNLTTGALKAHDPADRITRVAGASYDPAAAAPRWERFLTEALEDPDLIAAVARCFGGCALPGIVRDHVLPIVHGPGGAGKGTFVETIAAAMGDYAIAAEPELLLATRGGGGHPTGQMDLLGARLAFVSETDDGRRMAAATMKRLTGGDTIRARKMRQDFVQFRPSHLLVLVTNHLPTMPAGDDPAVWRRVRVVPFIRVPSTPDKRLPEQLRAELPGVLAWLVAGMQDYAARGDDAAWPEAVTTATSAYRGRSDVLGSFLADATVEAPQGATVPTGALYGAWKAWLEQNAPDVRPGRTGDFVARLKDRGENVMLSTDKGSRTVVHGRRLVAVSDVWDVSTPLPEIESSHRDNAGETSETSEASKNSTFATSKNTTFIKVCSTCSTALDVALAEAGIDVHPGCADAEAVAT